MECVEHQNESDFMLRVEQKQPNYLQNFSQKKSNPSHKPSFEGKNQEITDFVKEFVKKNNVDKVGFHGWLSSLSQFLARNKGEIQTQAVNAVFTCTLAPAFIAFNPISKQDEKTKKYTALRQPISALNTILISVPLTTLINHHTERLASIGHLKSIDLRSNPNSDYLGRIFEKEYKKVKNNKNELETFLNNNGISKEAREKLEKEIKDTFPQYEGVKLEKEIKKGWKELYIKHTQKKASEFFTELLHEKPENLVNNTNITGKLTEYHIENLNDYLKENNLHEIDSSKFIKDHFDFDFFEEKLTENGKAKIKLELKEEAFGKKIKQINAIDFLRKIGFVGYEIEDDGKLKSGSIPEENLKTFLLQKRQEPVAEFLKNAHNITSETATKEAEEIGKMTSRNMQFTINGKIIEEESITLEKMLDTLKIKKSEFIEDINTKKIAEFMEKYAKKLVGMEGLTGTSVKDIAKQLIQNNKKPLERKFSGVKNYVGIFFNLGIAAIACTTLNWTYPRIVEKLFPSLAKNDSPKGGKK